jgi:hypothetical protein
VDHLDVFVEGELLSNAGGGEGRRRVLVAAVPLDDSDADTTPLT